MNILDENIPLDQREVLQAWGIHCRTIGQDVAERSIGDDNIIALLHHLKSPTFFTRDEDFFKRGLCHSNYCLVFLDLAPEECALFIRRILRHPRLSSRAKRMGFVIRAHHDGFSFWEQNHATLQLGRWLSEK